MPKNLVKHNIAPVFNKNSKILILGSFPSVFSRKTNFFTLTHKTDFGEY